MPAAAARSQDDIRQIIDEAFHPAHFYIAASCDLIVEHREEEISWEVFRGRLLDPAQTRARRTFESWNGFWRDGDTLSGEPLLSVKWDRAANTIHVVRAIHSYAWEGYHAGDNVYLSRETQKWVRELVGSIKLAEFRDLADLQAELHWHLLHAIIGTSRLPLTSVEAPLPAFVLGQLMYCRGQSPDHLARPMRSARAMVQFGLEYEPSWTEKVKLLEATLRATPMQELPEITDLWVTRWTKSEHTLDQLIGLLRTVFNEISLSPYTDFVSKALSSLHLLESRGHFSLADSVDFLAHLLRQIGRHLTAYDLVTFHHRGANYPDALLLDEVLKAYLDRIESCPEVMLAQPDAAELEAGKKRLRRRALRQGWLLRTRYEGHPVPDVPTSQGENTRVMPASHPRVSEEQIINPARRSKRLYTGDALDARLGTNSRAVLRQSIDDLGDMCELDELGTALFLDRPLGIGKHPSEPDHTPLLSYVAVSRSLAGRRLHDLAERLPGLNIVRFEALLRDAPALTGVPLAKLGGPARPVPVALEDARRVAEDFVFLRTTESTAIQFLACFDLAAVPQLHGVFRMLIARVGDVIRIFDAAGDELVNLHVDVSRGYTSRRGIEYPVAGLYVLDHGGGRTPIPPQEPA